MKAKKLNSNLHNRRQMTRNRRNEKLKEETAPTAHLVGFARGLEPEKILGATNSLGKIGYLIKWKGINNDDMVTAEEVKQRCPQLLISFYEQCIVWTDNIGTEAAGGETAAREKS
ncbi:blast:Chromobox protein homolog 5 [Drosophila guanche]|uniref:Blast:Chromobox protein homolog 5 n=1 Tax=Drosophila guanche TaxID=7266 RepID=A0A3B0JES8_DROGU|nr:blast:Chromobox protein homolog 5 [Drosophila guanche]